MRHRWNRARPTIRIETADAQRMIDALPGAGHLRHLSSLDGGLANTNFRVDLDGEPRTVLLRLYQLDPTQAEKEAALAKRLRDQIPVPNYLHVGSDRGNRYAIVEWVDGERLETALTIADSKAMHALGASCGAVLARIHAVTFPQTGFLDGELRVAQPVVFDSALLARMLRESLLDGAGARFVEAALAKAVTEYALSNGQLSWGGPPCLTHADFNGSNILVRDDAVKAVIDWEFAFAGTPAIDFGNLIRNHPDAAFVDSVTEAYVAAGGRLPTNWRKLARLSDLAAWADFLQRTEVDPVLVEDAIVAIKSTITD
jgi:aminoglycoside phosphotransferase (APT) family kinase protein